MHSFRTYLSEMGNPDKDFIEDGVRWVQFRHNKHPIPHHDDANLEKAMKVAKTKGKKIKLWDRNTKKTGDGWLYKNNIMYPSGNNVAVYDIQSYDNIDGVWDLKQGFKNIRGTSYKDYMNDK